VGPDVCVDGQIASSRTRVRPPPDEPAERFIESVRDVLAVTVAGTSTSSVTVQAA
jgi:hypothetical protein